MSGPLGEATRPRWSDEWGDIRAITLAHGPHGWRVDVDIDEDREPGESPRDVRLYLLADEEPVSNLTVPVEVLRKLAERISEL